VLSAVYATQSDVPISSPPAEAAFRDLNMELITLKDVYKTYYLGEVEVPALKAVSLEIRKGEMVALMGASGSGKTTLMNLLGCLDRPTSGQYWLDGEEISQLSPQQRADVRNRKIGFVFQSFNLLPRTSALENVMMPMDYSHLHISEKEAQARGAELLELVGLGHRMDHHPSQMSGGQQQRVAIARALVNRPSLLLADEPTGNLDSATTEEILQTFENLDNKEGITIVVVTHEWDVGKHCKRIIWMRDGRIEGADHEAIQHAAVAHSPGGQAADQMELVRFLAAHEHQVNEVAAGLSPQDQTELSRLLETWSRRWPGQRHPDESSPPAS
jgi:ABC-type lipoprotein export system ATPase subunit